MYLRLALRLAVALSMLSVASANSHSEVATMIEGIELTWLGHASLKAKAAGKVVFFDPWKLTDAEVEPADLILITHPHHDHLSVEDVKRLATPETQIVTVKDCAAQLSGHVTTVGPGDAVTVGGLRVEAVPAYNLTKQFHPKENGWVGLIVELAGKRIFHAGDTDYLPEHANVKCDIAVLPCGGKYTMDAAEAAKAANAINPAVAIPIHFGDLVGSAADAERFKALCKCPVQILKPAR